MKENREKPGMRVGVIGTGAMGQFHVRVYREIGAELVGISDMNIGRAEEVASKYKTRAYPT